VGNCLGGHAGEEEALIEKAMDAVTSAASDAAPRLTALLQFNAAQASWSPGAVSSLRVEAEGTTLTVVGDDAALLDEYGDVETRPKPSVRLFSNRRSPIDQEILSAVEDRLEGLL
jgi:hypothetical protein